MNRTEHLIEVLAEECGEVAKECHKSNRFGLNDKVTRDPSGPRGTAGPTNREKIINELNDLLGAVKVLIEEGILPDDWQDPIAQEAKAQKVKSFMVYAKSVGALE